jgi:hypothetical protein
VKNEVGLLHRVKGEQNILPTVKRGKANWIGRILCRNYLLKHVIEGKIEGMGRRGKYESSYWLTLRETEDTGI